MRIFGVIPFIKLQNDTDTYKVKRTIFIRKNNNNQKTGGIIPLIKRTKKNTPNI